jgi:hypothetical protein
MKTKIILTALLLFSSFLLKAQQTSKLKAQPDSLIKIIPFMIGEYGATNDYRYSSLYTIGGKLVNKEDVTSRLLGYGPSAIEYKAATKNITLGYILYGGSFAAIAGSTFEFVKHSKTATAQPTFINGQPAFTYGSQNKTGAYILAGIGVGLLVSAFMIITHAHSHLKKSVWAYNLRFQ